MIAGNEPTEFEAHARRVLEDSAARVSSRVRSRLNQARQAAVAEIAASRPSPLRSFLNLSALMPAAGAALAAGVVAVILFTQSGGERGMPAPESGHATFEDLELLSDNDGLELIENFDGSFYEWAATQSEAAEGGASG